MGTFEGWLLGASLAAMAATGIAYAEGTTPPADPAPVTQPASQPGTPSDNAAQNAAGKDPGDEIVCKKQPPPIGSRVGARKVCRTAREWEVIQAQAREVTEEIQSRKIPPPAN